MWRSLMFVPTLNERLVAGAVKRGSDVIVLDLEAAVALERKTEARNQLAETVPALKSQAATVAVRVNLADLGAEDDLLAACDAGAEIIVIPRATPAFVARLASIAGSDVQLIPLIEDPRGVIEALAIAEAADSVVAVGLGVEDYATEMQSLPTPTLLEPAGFQVIQAARAANRMPLVIMDTIADYKDKSRFEGAARRARLMGASGGFAIHPTQVDALNSVFTPDQTEYEEARRIVEAADTARQKGEAIASLDGQMIDAPIETRARAILALVENRR